VGGAGNSGFDFLHLLLVGGCTAHAEEKVVLVFDEENQYVLAQFVFVGHHVVVGMGDHSRLEDRGQVVRRHAILVGLGREHSEEVEDVEEKLLVQRRKFNDQALVGIHGLCVVEFVGVVARLLAFFYLLLVDAQRIAETFVELQGYDGLGQLVQVSAKYVGGIVNSIPGPIQSFSISLGGVKDLLEILNALGRSIESKNTFHIGGCFQAQLANNIAIVVGYVGLTFFFEKDAAFGNHDGHVSVNETLAVIVGQGDCHIGILDAHIERNTENAAGRFSCKCSSQYIPVTKYPKVQQSNCRTRASGFQLYKPREPVRE
jgi:hypothetical protein